MRPLALLALLLAPAYAAGPLLVERAEPLRFALASEQVGLHLAALALEPAGELAEAAELEHWPLFAGSLERRDAGLYRRLEQALRRAGQWARQRDAARLRASLGANLVLLEQARQALIPRELRADAAFQAALLAQLVEAAAEGYEEAAEGEEGAYRLGWGALQRARVLWGRLEPSLRGREATPRVAQGLEALAALLPSPAPPARFRDPEDAERASLDVAFALEAAVRTPLLPRELPPLVALVRRQTEQACQAARSGPGRLALEHAAAARFYYRAHLADPLGALEPALGDRLGALLQDSLPAAIRAGGTARVGAACEQTLGALEAAGGVLR